MKELERKNSTRKEEKRKCENKVERKDKKPGEWM